MKNYTEQLYHLLHEALQEDIGNGDHTTLSCIEPEKKGKATLKIKQDGILCGMHIAQTIFSMVEPKHQFIAHKQDGEAMKKGETAFEVEASIHTILKCERLVLNCMQRMSGIATLTHQYVSAIKQYKAKILDTRKTTPNFRLFEKEAVRIGGGMNHRFGLYDMILLKDNHIDYCGSMERAIQQAYEYTQKNAPDLRIEVEARNINEVKEVCKYGKGKVFRIMLDNFTPAQITEALAIIQNQFETEASGGINLQNITSYAETGIDYISVGALIHQAQSLDLSLKAVIIE
jgi:nicotinate-nucleotide pyrophosphorylase (carboxylating)